MCFQQAKSRKTRSSGCIRTHFLPHFLTCSVLSRIRFRLQDSKQQVSLRNVCCRCIFRAVFFVVRLQFIMLEIEDCYMLSTKAKMPTYSMLGTGVCVLQNCKRFFVVLVWYTPACALRHNTESESTNVFFIIIRSIWYFAEYVCYWAPVQAHDSVTHSIHKTYYFSQTTVEHVDTVYGPVFNIKKVSRNESFLATAPHHALSLTPERLCVIYRFLFN